MIWGPALHSHPVSALLVGIVYCMYGMCWSQTFELAKKGFRNIVELYILCIQLGFMAKKKLKLFLTSGAETCSAPGLFRSRSRPKRARLRLWLRYLRASTDNPISFSKKPYINHTVTTADPHLIIIQFRSARSHMLYKSFFNDGWSTFNNFVYSWIVTLPEQGDTWSRGRRP